MYVTFVIFFFAAPFAPSNCRAQRIRCSLRRPAHAQGAAGGGGAKKRPRGAALGFGGKSQVPSKTPPAPTPARGLKAYDRARKPRAQSREQATTALSPQPSSAPALLSACLDVLTNWSPTLVLFKPCSTLLCPLPVYTSYLPRRYHPLHWTC
jgi:hypothetical protein